MKKRDFESFYHENIDRIYRYVFFRVGHNTEVCEDLVSEIFMKALENYEKYDPKISKSAWIYRIAHNHLANYYRDKKDHVDVDEVAFFLEGEHGERTMEQIEATEHIRKALDELKKEDQLLVTMKYLEGYSYQEMAEVLDKSADALKVATYRAMKKLKSYAKH